MTIESRCRGVAKASRRSFTIRILFGPKQSQSLLLLTKEKLPLGLFAIYFHVAFPIIANFQFICEIKSLNLISPLFIVLGKLCCMYIEIRLLKSFLKMILFNKIPHFAFS